MSIALSDLELAHALAGVHSHARWCAENLSIRNKRGVIEPLKLWPAQLELDRVLERQVERRRPVRLVVLKARQVSFSVGVASEFFRRVPFEAGQHCFVVSERMESALNLFDYYRQFQRSYRAARNWTLPALTRDTEERLEWANGSYVQVTTAESVRIGRSFSLRYLHLSEFAFWRDPASVMTALMQCVPPDEGTCVVVESTANGVGGEFYDLWRRATDPNNQSDWVPVFFGWWQHPEYRMGFEGDREKVAFERDLSGQEKQLRDRYHLSLEQLHWRRWHIENQCRGSVERFCQEMPACPEEAFLTSGRPRFDTRAIDRQPTFRDPIVGGLEETVVGTRRLVQFYTRERGEMVVFKRPQDGRGYVIGADVAQGIDVEGAGVGESDPDYSVAQVLDQDTGEQVAVVRERLTPSAFAQYLYDLGRWYNWAFVNPEVNFEVGTLEELLRLGYPPHLIYRRQPTPDEQRMRMEGRLGWKTTTVTRPQLVSALDTALRESSIIIHDPVTLQELRTFVVKATGKAEASVGCHDDCVIALALAVVGLRQAPRDRKILPGGEAVGVVPRPVVADYRRGGAKKEMRIRF